jgi:PadR family transcriptional regulator, regulatory protein AphA
MPSKPTTTSFALLGLLALQPWTAYEIVAQMRRGLRFYWPRSQAHLYAELKRLVERGHATAEVVEGARKQRTRYTITSKGRTALRDWFSTEPAAPVVEVEGFLRVFLGDQTTAERLRESLEATARQAREFHVQGYAVMKDVLDTGGPFPQRLHLVVPMSEFLDNFYRMLIDWCEQTVAEIDQWPDTRDVGLTPDGRKRLAKILAQPNP